MIENRYLEKLFSVSLRIKNLVQPSGKLALAFFCDFGEDK